MIGDEADKDLEAALERSRQLHAAQLAAAKAEAELRGKEPFDLAKLETLCDTSHEGKMAPFEERQLEFERLYYVTFPRVMMLRELAAIVQELGRW